MMFVVWLWVVGGTLVSGPMHWGWQYYDVCCTAVGGRGDSGEWTNALGSAVL